ncbi:MAG: ABC transporter permease [Gammaproteobacteria bacterium]|nr:ABC transporter permease [Gammaproteobacteria bacterium]MCB1925693.1 ABC transporter permease [Gammaproteobacteria bacterium]
MTTRLALGVMLVWCAAALTGVSAPLHPDAIELTRILEPPSSTNVLGSDDLGRPVLDRLLAGAAVSLLVALVTVTLSATIGIAVGLFAGYVGGWADRIIGRVVEVFLAFPGMLLAIAMAAMLGPGLDNVIIALATMGWVGYARLVRVQVMTLKQRDHVLAARALGRRDLAIVGRHLLPLVMAPVWVEASFGVAAAVIAEAGLSFLGLGIQPPAASWGGMIRDGVRYLLVAPHLVLAPGIALFAVVMAANLLGDALRDRLDVTLRSTR